MIVKEKISVEERAEKPKQLEAHGGDRKSEDNQPVNNSLIYGSTNADYLTARIARDHPQILEEMKQRRSS